MTEKKIRIISLGAGVQNSYLYRMNALGLLGEVALAAIFAEPVPPALPPSVCIDAVWARWHARREHPVLAPRSPSIPAGQPKGLRHCQSVAKRH